MLVGDAKKPAELKDLRENHTESTVSFTLIADKEKIDEFENSKGGLLAKFKLSGSLTTSNMTLFDKEGRIVRFDSPLHIMEQFYEIRLEYYSKRKDNLIRNLEAEKLMLSNKARFVEDVCSGVLVVSNRKRKELLPELKERGFDLIVKDPKKKAIEDDDSEQEEEVDDAPSIAELAKGYEYLLGMRIWSLTFEKAEMLRAQLEEKVREWEELLATSPSAIWLKDLDTIEVALDERDVLAKLAVADEQRAQKKNQTRQAKITKKKKAATKKTKDQWESDMETDSDGDELINLDDSDQELFTEPAKPSQNARKRVAEKRGGGKPLVPAKSKDSEGILDDALLSQLKENLIVSPPAKKRASDESNEAISYSVELEANDTKKKFGMKKALPTLKKGATKAVSKGKKAAPKKTTKKAYLSSDDESDHFEFDDDEPVAKAVAPSSRVKRAAVEKVKTLPVYSFSDDDSDF